MVQQTLTTREQIKRVTGSVVSTTLPVCRYSNCIFVLAHMRCGSTALSNILCSRPEVSGYGEAHVRYDGRGALGRLVVNQALRRGWKPKASFLFDKILHSRHDADAAPEFFEARAIFVARQPAEAVPSITALYKRLGRTEYGTDEQSARYYVERLRALARLWQGFPPERRLGLTHSDLIREPEQQLARISGRLGFSPPLKNAYVSPAASRRGGAGDPVMSGKFNRIERQDPSAVSQKPGPDIAPGLLAEAEQAYAEFLDLISGQ